MSIDSRLLRHDTLLIEFGTAFKIMTETRIQFNLAAIPAPVISPSLYCCNKEVHFIPPHSVRAIIVFTPVKSLGRRPFALLKRGSTYEEPLFGKKQAVGPFTCLATDQ